MAECLEEKEKRIAHDKNFADQLSTLFSSLKKYSLDNLKYYEKLKGGNPERFKKSFNLLNKHLDGGIESDVKQILLAAHLYDFDYNTPANGFRSLVTIVEQCCLQILEVLKFINCWRSSYIFSDRHYSREIYAYVTMLGQLRAIMYYLCQLLKYCTNGNLFPDQNELSEEDYNTAERLMLEVETLCQQPFYGRCLGVQYCDSMKQPLKIIILTLASYAEGYSYEYKIAKLANALIGSGKYYFNAESKAETVVDVTRKRDIHFCKDFWSINENMLMYVLPIFVSPMLHVCYRIALAPNTLHLPLSTGDGEVIVHPPSVHSGVRPVNTRVISFRLRRGQESIFKLLNLDASKVPPSTREKGDPSDCLIVHVHGGGFVAQSSGSHEVYLRHWAQSLDVPIFCVDYSLAPEDPYPRQLEEVFFAYCWALKNCRYLGSTAKKVLLVGDSAGGNLAISVAMRAAQCGIQKPCGVLSAYGVTLIQYAPSPSRITSLMDPLLPIGVVANVLGAYANMTDTPTGIVTPEQPIIIKTNKLPSQSVANDGGLPFKEVSNDPAENKSLPRRGSCTQLNKSQENGKGKRRNTLPHCPSMPNMSTNKDDLSHYDGLSPPSYAQLRHFPQSPVMTFKNIQIPSDPYMSPQLATDALLKSLCPISLVACHLDPMLDDSVMFAKRLKKINHDVSLDVLQGLSHGFLNFALVSDDAAIGSQICINRMKKMLGLTNTQENVYRLSAHVLNL